MKNKRKNKDIVDSKEINFLKKYGQLHPINEIEEPPQKIKIVNDDDINSNQIKKKTDGLMEKHFIDEDTDLRLPYSQLLEEINSNEINKNPLKNKSKEKKTDNDFYHNNSDLNEENIKNDDETIKEQYSQEYLSKDKFKSDEMKENDPFHKHFEKGIDEKFLNFKSDILMNKEMLNFSSLGMITYKRPLNEFKQKFNPKTDIKEYHIKSRIMDRLDKSINSFLPNSKLDEKDLELLNIILNYVDIHDSNINLSSELQYKFIYSLHALNHVLKTRSRIISHNDKIKNNKSNFEIEYRDQGMTRPKVLILVPFKKTAFKIIQIMISLLMEKNEENITNKKKFYNEFSDKSYEKKELKLENSDIISKEEYNHLFSGNVDDFFRIGLAISKKTLKLYTDFYSSDVIIASPVALKSIIGNNGENNHDIDFLSSIEILIVDNADILLMQNWDHVQSIFVNLHLQPKKSHNVDFSRVRNWALDGLAKYYRQTLIFSSINAPEINSIFNKWCFNYEGKIQIKQINQTGTISQIVLQLPHVFHKLICDKPFDLPKTRFDFFVEKVLPQFKDEMMSHTLIFIPSYFDYVQLKNYFKKNEISFKSVCEYSDAKEIDRARFLFYHGKTHFLLITERFHFYKRYKIRGINHIVFYDLPTYPNFYANFCNFLLEKKNNIQNFSSTVIYSKLDAQKLSSVVGFNRASIMINSEKNVHMFMIDNKI